MTALPIYRTPAAEDDLVEIWRYVALDNAAAATRLLDQIAERIQQLSTFPELGAVRTDVAEDARMLTVGRYVVLYRITTRRIEIVRVVHGARDATALF